MPDYYFKYLNGGVDWFPDFTKRITAIRELFEECNLLLAKKKPTPYSGVAKSGVVVEGGSKTALKEAYLQKYESNFIKFCKNMNMYPSIDKIFGFYRLSSPVGFYPANDTQFYLYFCDFDPIDDIMELNQDEFTEHKWLTIDEVLDLYQRGEIPIFFPQMLMLTSLKFLNKNYMELRHSAEHGFQQNILNFITNKSHTWDFD